MKNKEIAEKLDYHPKHIEQMVHSFMEVGPENNSRLKYGGKNRVLNPEEEEALLKSLEDSAKKGALTRTREIRGRLEGCRSKKARPSTSPTSRGC